MTRPTFVSSNPTENNAPGWAGVALADGGYASLIAYLLLTGIFLGWLRQFAAMSRRIEPRNGYVLFILLGGFSAESGILSIADNLTLAATVTLLAWLLGTLIRLRERRIDGSEVNDRAASVAPVNY